MNRTYFGQIATASAQFDDSLFHRMFRRAAILTCLAALAATLPVVASPTAKSLKNAKGFTWLSKSTANIDIFFEAGSPAERDIEKVAANLENSRAGVEKLLGGSIGGKTESFIVDSRTRMKQLVGEEGNAFTFGSYRLPSFKIDFVTTMVYSDTIKALGAHETCHALARLLWGKDHGLWINEGLAVYSDDQWQGLPLHSVAKVLLDRASCCRFQIFWITTGSRNIRTWSPIRSWEAS